MFIGHFAVGFAAKRVAPKVPLALLMVGPLWADVLFPIFVLTGVERARIVPGITPVMPVDLEYMPWSHSLLTTVVWAALLGGLYLWRTRDRNGAWAVAALVASHFVLDWIAHRPDVPLWPGDSPRFGLGLWFSVPGTLVVESAMFAFGVWTYTTLTRARNLHGTVAWWSLCTVLVATYLGFVFGPPPPDIETTAWGVLASLVLIPLAMWIERNRQDVQPAT
jgi:membrane-bound metal-dependent hydrolase YbcI (DUF457 family)